MARQSDRRQVARVTIPPQLGDQGVVSQPVRLLDLSREGARVEHADPLHAGLRCVVDLPPALGGGTLSGRVMWSTLHHTEQSLEGEQRRYFRSGLTWTGLTPEQFGALAAALDILKASQNS